ncbi:serine-threonine protein kinase, plant-type [Dorcoceras hygrometricum]|uniref:Serine-threonine protein kinase, plant-type n=1 Tax=Dorcoceras hygrometricum TaxID=472368 RepID=A0A2Z7BWI8_9LAMI|nr:serine-threonine protein kinase, plant-type [Dorcoceras hygrometricum]
MKAMRALNMPIPTGKLESARHFGQRSALEILESTDLALSVSSSEEMLPLFPFGKSLCNSIDIPPLSICHELVAELVFHPAGLRAARRVRDEVAYFRPRPVLLLRNGQTRKTHFFVVTKAAYRPNSFVKPPKSRFLFSSTCALNLNHAGFSQKLKPGSQRSSWIQLKVETSLKSMRALNKPIPAGKLESARHFGRTIWSTSLELQ